MFLRAFAYITRVSHMNKAWASLPECLSPQLVKRLDKTNSWDNSVMSLEMFGELTWNINYTECILAACTGNAKILCCRNIQKWRTCPSPMHGPFHNHAGPSLPRAVWSLCTFFLLSTFFLLRCYISSSSSCHYIPIQCFSTLYGRAEAAGHSGRSVCQSVVSYSLFVQFPFCIRLEDLGHLHERGTRLHTYCGPSNSFQLTRFFYFLKKRFWQKC